MTGTLHVLTLLASAMEMLFLLTPTEDLCSLIAVHKDIYFDEDPI